jgi:hypothetical protein
MSYVQGTSVTVELFFTDPDSTADPVDPIDGHTLFDPDDVEVTIWDGEGTEVSAFAYTDDTGEVQRVSQGVYSFAIDTSACAGLWKYEAKGTGALQIVKQRTLRVKPSYVEA